MIEVNTMAPLLLAHARLAKLAAAKRTLAVIGSTAARGKHGDLAVYAATTAALDGAARALRLEWEGRVRVQIIHPGPTATAMHAKAGMGESPMHKYFTPAPIVAASIAQTIRRKSPGARFGALYTLRHARKARAQ